MDWTEFIAAFVGFFLLHSVPVRPPVRLWLVARLGQAGFGIVYSILSLALLALLFFAADRAPFVLLWREPPGAHWLVLAAMVAACLILAFGLFRPNPLSFGGRRNEAFDPQKPGLLRWVRHPVLGAFFLWSAAHLVVNGDLAHALVFGSFAVFALAGMKIIDHRRRKEMGSAAWLQTVAQMRSGPLLPPHGVVLRLSGALGMVVVLLLLHPSFAGVGVLWRFWP